MAAEDDLAIDLLRVALDHAWSWFSLHSAQRLQLVNYFLVTVAFLTAAIGTALQSHRNVLGGVVAILGVLITQAFARLELRTKELVKAAEVALADLERTLARRTSVGHLALVDAVETPSRPMSSYGVIIRLLTWAGSAAFAAAAVYCFTSR